MAKKKNDNSKVLNILLLENNNTIPYTSSIDDIEKEGFREYLWLLAKNRRDAHLKVYGKAASVEDYYNDFLTNSEGTFNYRRWYNTTPNKELLEALNMGTAHWRDKDGKTSLSPTFSVESPYSGYVNPYNPLGLIGGSWEGDLPNDKYIFSDSLMNNNWDINKTLEEFEWSRANEKTEDGVPVNTRAVYKGGAVLPEIIIKNKNKNNIYWPGGPVFITEEEPIINLAGSTRVEKPIIAEPKKIVNNEFSEEDWELLDNIKAANVYPHLKDDKYIQEFYQYDYAPRFQRQNKFAPQQYVNDAKNIYKNTPINLYLELSNKGGYKSGGRNISSNIFLTKIVNGEDPVSIHLNEKYKISRPTVVHELAHAFRLGNLGITGDKRFSSIEVPLLNHLDWEIGKEYKGSGYTNSEKNKLNKAYNMNGYKLDYDPLWEKGTTNTEVRYRIWKELYNKLGRRPSLEETDNYIKSYDKRKLQKTIRDANAYGYQMYKNGMIDDYVKDALINVAQNDNPQSDDLVYYAANGGKLNRSIEWNELSMKERAAYIRMGVANGYKDIDSIREVYNEFRKGGTKLTKRAPYIYEELPRLLLEAGVSVRVTSGYRKPGAAGKLGKFSHHTLYLAVDIVPSGTSTWNDIRDAIYNNPKIRSYMLANGYGLLDETDPKIMKQTGATGAHFHIGKDTKPARQYAARASANIDNIINNPRYVEQQLAINNLPSQSIQPTSQLPLQNTNNIAMEGNLPEVVITPKRQYVLVDPYDMLDRMNTMMVLPILPIIEEQPKPLTANERLKQINDNRITLLQRGLEESIIRNQLLGTYDSDKLKRDVEDLLFYRNMNESSTNYAANGGNLYPIGGSMITVNPGDKVDTTQCAAWSNGLLRDNGYLINGNAWNLGNVDMLFNGYDGLERPDVYDKKLIMDYNHAATNNVFKNFDSKTLDTSKPYVVNMYYNNSPSLETAYNEGDSVTGTHTGVLTFDPDSGKWWVTHNIHGKIHQEPFINLQRNTGNYGVTAIYQPREKTLWNRFKSLLGFAYGGNMYDGTTMPSLFILNLYKQKPFYEELDDFNRELEAKRQALAEVLRELIATKGKLIADRKTKNYFTTSNDNTQVVSKEPIVEATKPVNPHLEERAIEGAKAHAIWEKEHPILNTVGLGLSTIPFVAAASPILIPAGEAFASTTLAGISAPMWTDAALTAGFGAHGLDHAINEGIDGWGDAAMTALEVAPLGRIVKPMFNAGDAALFNLLTKHPLIKLPIPKSSKISPETLANLKDTPWYLEVSKEFGEDIANLAVLKLQTPGFFEWFYGENPQEALLHMDRYANLRDIINKITGNIDEGKAAMAGSGAGISLGNFDRVGAALHDLDVTAYMNDASKAVTSSEAFIDNLSLWDFDRLSQSPIFQTIKDAYPKTFKDAKVTRTSKLLRDLEGLNRWWNNDFKYGKVVPNPFPDSYIEGRFNITPLFNISDLGANRVAMTRINGEPIDIFLSDRYVPTVGNSVSADNVLGWKRAFIDKYEKAGYTPRAKDIRDIENYVPFSEENPVINAEGQSLYAPFSFKKPTLINDLGIPVLAPIETYPGSNQYVPAFMNYKGEIRSIGSPQTIELPQIISENAASMTPEQWTAAQDAAIARGDIAEAQRLRDLHFGLSNSKYKGPLFRGTDENSPIMDLFKMQVNDVPAVYLTPYERYARQYGDNVRKLYLNTQNPWIDKFGKDYSRLSIDRVKKSLEKAIQKGDNTKIEKYRGILNDIEGTDAAYRYRMDGVNGDLTKIYEGTPPEILGRDVNKIKSADAVTYDNNGVRIPLGERDNFNINDVRYGFNTKESNIETTKENILNFINNDIIPRILAQGHTIEGYNPTFRELDPINDALDMQIKNDNAGAWFTPSVNDITLRGPLNNLNFGLMMHEAGGHGLRYNMQSSYRPTTRYYLNEYLKGRGDNPKIAEELMRVHTGKQAYNSNEILALLETYPWVLKYFEQNPSKNPNAILLDLGAINTLFRASLSDNGKITGKELDKKITNTPDEILLDKLILLPYTSSISEDLARITGKSIEEIETMNIKELKTITKYPEVLKIINRMRETMKKVGSYVVPITIGSALYKKVKE